MIRVTVNPELLRWAIKRANQSKEKLRAKFPKIDQWERGEVVPTFKQIERFAKAVSVPIGYLFLSKPPEEPIPIPDLRTMPGSSLAPPSPELLDTIYLSQRRQAWYRDYALSVGEEVRSFVGRASLNSPVEKIAGEMRTALNFDLDERRKCLTWTEALRNFIEKAEALGVLVMVSGVVGTNTRRRLNPREFRGFALADNLAPLVFINGADTKAAQIFTLAHELAHLWLGETALSDAAPDSAPSQEIERWCNAVAAEFLVPIKSLRLQVSPGDVFAQKDILARQFKVSTLVILRRLLDGGWITKEAFRKAYNQELEYLLSMPKRKGGDFYLAQEVRASRRFVKALLVSTLEGYTLYRDAFQLLGIKKTQTFDKWGQRLGVIM